MNFSKNFITTFLLLITITITRSQKSVIGVPGIKNYTKSEYRSGTQNWDIDQDDNGNVYFANENGLLQFDGLSWQLYKVANCLKVRSVKYDKNSGRIYVGGYSEFGYFESNDKGNLIYTSLSDLVIDSNFVESDFIWKIHIYKDEVIFQSFSGAYIYKNDKISSLKAPDRFQFSFKADNKLFFQDLNYGILEYNNGTLIPLKGTSVLNDYEIWGMFSMPNNKYIISTLEKGLFIYENEKITSWDTEANRFIKKNGSLGGISLKNDTYILNSVLNGTITCDVNGKVIQHLNIKKGLLNHTVLTSFIDYKNNLWLGLDNGISYVNKNSPFTFFDPSYNLSTVYASIVHNNVLYTATNQGVFYHELNSSFSDNDFTLLKGITAQSWNLQVIGNELICSNNNGAYIIKDKKVIRKIDVKGYYGFKRIPTSPNYVVGANYGGFSLFEITKNGIELKGVIDGFYNSTLFFEIDDNFIWLLRDENLYKMTLNVKNKTFTAIDKISHLNSTKNKVNSLQKINGKVTFETNNQFYTFNNKENIFNEDLGLSNLFKNCLPVDYIKEDAIGNLWYTSNGSLGVLLKESLGSYKNSHTIFSNLTGNLVNDNLSINTHDAQNIFIGTTNGLANYNSKFKIDTTDKPKAFIRSFTYNGGIVILGNPSEKKVTYKMPYTKNNVKFTFSSPEFDNSKNLSFSFQLLPFDSNWSKWSKNTIKEYTNLTDGEYIMKVKTRNSYNKESDTKILKFVITPPWYKHYIAYIAYILILILIIYFTSVFIKMRYRKREYYKTIEHRKIYLEKESKIRKEQYHLENQIQKLKREKLQSKLRSKNKELVNNSLQVVKKNKILNKIIKNLSDMEVNSFNETNKALFNSLKKNITKEINADNSWKDLEKHIKNVHFEFLKRLKEKCPTITPRELDLSTYLLMNMTTKEISEVMNISTKSASVSRYRLRKKLGLERDQNLTGYLLSI
jgi:DNA-binding CsgD family transcriptional regulator/ligand-binding sensor domain-containing protein